MVHLNDFFIKRGLAVAVLVLLVSGLATRQLEAQTWADSRFDITGNGIINDADAAMVISAIAILQEQGVCISDELAGRDFNGDGCVTVADLQIVLSHWGERTRPEPPPPGIGAQEVATFVVNSAGNATDSNPGDGVCNTDSTVTVNGQTFPECTLRAAIQESNVRADSETINFNILNSNGSCPSGVTTINDTLLIIDDSDDAGMTINGYSQCGASPNSEPINGNAVIKIQIFGTSSDANLKILSANNTVKGLSIYGSESDLQLYTDNAHHNIIQGNLLGKNVAYSSASRGYALDIRYGPSANLIGGAQPAERNIIAGSSQDAIAVTGRGNPVKFNVIIGNYVGVRQNGVDSAGNRADGIDISEGAYCNWFGASPPGTGGLPPQEWVLTDLNACAAGNPAPPVPPFNNAERNVIARNGKDGIEVSHSTETKYNYIVNNYIGVNANGGQAGNGQKGITLEDLVNTTFIYNNVIANNVYNGVRGYVSNYNQIVNNKIGVGPDGVTSMPNGTNVLSDFNYHHGVRFYHGSRWNLIKGNIIANHAGFGVHLSKEWSYLQDNPDNPLYAINDTSFNTITQNSIYNNGRDGIKLQDGANGNITPPQIYGAVATGPSAATVTGTSCITCVIEVFIAQENDSYDFNSGGEGKTYLISGTVAATGTFLINVTGVTVGQKVTATATDAMGNTSQFSPNVYVTDENAPSGNVLVNGSSYHESAYSEVLAQFSAQDNVAVNQWRYSVDSVFNASSTSPSWQLVPSPGQVFTETETLTNLSEGYHTVYAQYKDDGGNISPVYQAAITVVHLGDPSHPSTGITINDGYAWTNDPDLSLELLGPLYATSMEIGDNPADLNGSYWEPYSTQSSWTLNDPYGGTQSFTYTVYSRYQDANDNITSPVSDDIGYDPISPTIAATINITGEINLSNAADDSGGSGVEMMLIYQSGVFTYGWISYAPSYTWPSPGNIDNIKVQVRDRAGNESVPVDVIIVLDERKIYLPIIIRQ